MKKVLLLLSIAVLVGCSHNARGIRALEKGQHLEACNHFVKSMDKGEDRGAAFYNVGWCYENGHFGNPPSAPTAIRYYKMAARWNRREAIDRLTALGQEVPEPDAWLAATAIAQEQQRSSDRAFFRGLGQAMQEQAYRNQYQPPQRIQPFSCHKFGNSVYCN